MAIDTTFACEIPGHARCTRDIRGGEFWVTHHPDPTGDESAPLDDDFAHRAGLLAAHSADVQRIRETAYQQSGGGWYPTPAQAETIIAVMRLTQ